MAQKNKYARNLYVQGNLQIDSKVRDMYIVSSILHINSKTNHPPFIINVSYRYLRQLLGASFWYYHHFMEET